MMILARTYRHLNLAMTGLLLVMALALNSHSQTAQGLLREVFLGIPGNSLAELTNSAAYPEFPSSSAILADQFESPPASGDNYGQRLRGYILAPLTGEYIFWIASDDQSVLFLGLDDDSATARAIAHVSNWTPPRDFTQEPSQQSSRIRLTSGRVYYIEALMKEGNGDDHLSVRWQLPNGTVEEPIPAMRLVPFGTAIAPPSFRLQPAATNADEGRPVIFTVRVRNGESVGYQWLRNNAPIPGATFASYTNTVVALTDHQAFYRCLATNSLGSAWSDEARLTVNPDRTPPQVTAVMNAGTTNIIIQFSEPVINALRISNYRIEPAIPIEKAAYGDSGSTLVLTTANLVLRQSYMLSISGIVDLASAANPIAVGTKAEFTAIELTLFDVGSPVSHGRIQAAADGFDFTGGGRDIGGTNDVFLYGYQPRTGDFDLRVLVTELTLTDPWAKAGLMARESLAPGARFAASLTTPGISGSTFLSRSITGAVAQAAGSFPANHPNTWLRLRRVNDQFTGFASLDGTRWALLGETTWRSTNALFVGLATTSRNTNQLGSAKFRSYSVIQPGTLTAGAYPVDREPIGPSSRRGGLVISEIMYHPLESPGGPNLEFIELCNTQPFDEDLSGWRLDGAVEFTFPRGTLLPAGGYLVVAGAATHLKVNRGTASVLGNLQGRMGNAGGRIRLRNRLDAVLLDARYGGDTEQGWPAATDGAGHSLVLARPSYGESDPRAWEHSREIGGSPGAAESVLADPLDGLRINEFLAHTDPPGLDFIELRNLSSTNILELGGLVLTDDARTNRFVIPQGVKLFPGAVAAFDQNQLGFALDSTGESIFLKNPAGNRILDAVRFGPQANGIARGRVPASEHRPDFHELQRPTPGTTNASPWIRPIVITEIMYHPISGDGRDEYIELHNTSGTAVDLSGWRFESAVDFAFPPGTHLGPGGYLAVANDAARLAASHPELAASNVIGNFSGALANGGDRIVLAMPETVITTNLTGEPVSRVIYIAVDEVAFDDGGKWGQWSDGGGSSLELIDPKSDNRLAANWADSDETRKSRWNTIEATGVLDHGSTAFAADNLALLLQGAGECLVDDVEVTSPAGNLVANPGFEGGLNNWATRGTHIKSQIRIGEGSSGTRSLRVVASGRGDPGPNQVVTPLSSPLLAGAVATIRARARWLKGNPELLLRLHGNFLEAHGTVSMPSNLGTPGAPNSRALANRGPAIFAVRHDPVLPAAFAPLRVMARIQDPDGISAVRLKFRYDPSTTLLSTNMFDNGLNGDELAGDGIHTATIPGVGAGHITAFHVEATDAFFLPAIARFPEGAPGIECLALAGEVRPPGSFGAYRLWFTEATHAEWRTRHPGSNEPLDATFVSGDGRIIYNIGAYYSGSPFHWRGYSGPMAGTCNYSLIFPGDDLFLGAKDFVLNLPSNQGNDSTGQREQTFYWMTSLLDRPATYRRYVWMFVNGLRRGNATSGFIYEDAQQPNQDVIETWFPGATDGELYKIEDWFEFDSAGLGFSNVDASLQSFTTSEGEKKLARYRWAWRKRAVDNSQSASDYAALFELVDSLNAPANSAYADSVGNAIDVQDWFRAIGLRHAVGDWDAYGYRRGKNMYTYRPPGGRWHLLDWDVAFAFGQGDGAVTDPFSTIEPVVRRIFEHPQLRRAYLQALQDIVDLALDPEKLAKIVDAKRSALLANGVNVGAADVIKSYAATRRGFLRGMLATNEAPFTLSTHGGQSFTTNRSLITLEGTAPVRAANITVNGIPYAASWPTVTGWSMQIPLEPGLNSLAIAAVDRNGSVLTNGSAVVQVNSTILAELAENHLVFNEIMYHPVVDGAEFVELHNTSITRTFDLSHYRIDGIDFDLPPGTLLEPQGFLVIAKNPEIFRTLYADTPARVLGPFDGDLARGGETIRLVRIDPDSQLRQVIDQVNYDDALPWPETADGSGPSLQVIDPFRDNSRPANWAAAQPAEPSASQWEFVSVTGPAPANNPALAIYLTAPGLVYLDEISLVTGNIPASGVNLISNPGFDTPILPAWIVGGAMTGSTIAAEPRFTGLSALRVSAAQAGSSSSTGAIVQSIPAAAVSGQNLTLSFWYLPGRGSGDLVMQFGDQIAARRPAQLPAPNLATPGAVNSVSGLLPPFPEVWLNEVSAENLTGARDRAGDRDPWVELHNSASTALDLGGYYLGPDLTSVNQWAFPPGTFIAPKSFLLVWLDAETFENTPSELHASFRIPPAAGQVVFSRFQPAGIAVLDQLSYRFLPADQAFGNVIDGNPFQRQVLGAPSPGSPNIHHAPIQLRINEWMASNAQTLPDPADNDYDDWFEIHNPGLAPVDLSGFFLTDTLTNSQKYMIPSGFIVPAGGYLLVWADEETRQNGPNTALHVNFKLSQAGETIEIFDPSGRLLHAVTFGSQTVDVSRGLMPDGTAGTDAAFTRPTPGASNQTGAAGNGPRIQSITAAGTGVTLVWSAAAGARYQVEYKAELTASVWVPLDGVITANGNTASVTDASLAGSGRFYRIVERR